MRGLFLLVVFFFANNLLIWKIMTIFVAVYMIIITINIVYRRRTKQLNINNLKTIIMKTRIVTLIVALMAIASGVQAQVAVNATNFPDENFRNWLLDPDNINGYGADGQPGGEGDNADITSYDGTEENK